VGACMRACSILRAVVRATCSPGLQHLPVSYLHMALRCISSETILWLKRTSDAGIAQPV
jgi:hypothetical protein